MRRLLWPAILLALSAGCSLTKCFTPAEDSVHAQRVRREGETTRQFSGQRDTAEFEAAMARWNQQDPQGCRDELERLLARNPNHCQARLLLADVLVDAHQPQEALAQVQKALAAHPSDPDVQFAMGLMLDANGRNSQALPYYERAARAEPANEAYALSYRTAREAADGPNEAAGPANSSPPVSSVPPSRAAGEAARSSKGDSPILAERKLGQSPPPSDPKDPKVPAELPQTASARPLTANAPASLPLRDHAVTQCVAIEAAKGDDSKAAAEETVSAAARLQKGCDALDGGSPETALAYFRAAAARDPQNPQILIDAATAALRHNQPRMAVDLLGPASKRLPSSAAVHRILGTAYYRLGEYSSSQSALQQALSLDKSNALSYFLMGCTLMKLGQPDGAELHFRQAQALDPRYAVQRAGATGQ